MRIFLDANILFSAAKSDGAIRALLAGLLAGDHVLVADPFVVTEARRNLAVKARPDAVNALDLLLAHVEVGAEQASMSARPSIDWLPPKDRPVLNAAIARRCAALVTGDRTHFAAGYGKVFEGVTIHSPAQLASALWPIA